MEYGLKPLGREKFWLWMMLVPTLIGLIFGVFGSIMATLALSFTHWDLLTPPQMGWDCKLSRLVQRRQTDQSAVEYLQIQRAVCPGVVIVSLFVAILLNRKIKGVSIFRTIYFLPTVTSAVATALVWNMIYGKDTGILNYIVAIIGDQAGLLAMYQ